MVGSMHVSASGNNYSSLAFIGDLAFIITLTSNPEVYHRYYRFCVNVKLLFSFYSMRWHQDSCTKQHNLQITAVIDVLQNAAYLEKQQHMWS